MISRDQVIRAFLDKLAEYGIAVSAPERVELDGNWHRAHVEGDRGRAENLSYRIYYDDRPAGFFEDHKRGVTGTFSVTNGEDMSPADREAARAAWKARQQAREAEQERSYADAAQRAQRAIQVASGDPPRHPYIQRKGIASTASIKAEGDLLLVPVYQEVGGQACSYQSINVDGEKLFMPGGKMAGAFHTINGTDRSRVLVCEGYATGAALVAATGHPAACAMSAGNLAAVVRKMQAKFPEREIVACVDNDHDTLARTGRNPGMDAAAGLGVRVLAPTFPEGAGPKETDWDDWLRAGYGTADDLRRMVDGEPPAAVPATIDEPEPEVVPVVITAALDTAADPEADGLPAMYSEDNVALRFSQLFTDDLRYVAPWGRWMRWRDQRWTHEDTLEVFDLARKVCRSVSAYAQMDGTLSPAQKSSLSKIYGQGATVASIERLARSDRRHAATIGQWDADPWLLNTPAGVVDLRTGAVTPGSRTAYMTKIARVAPAGDCPTWRAFLDVTTDGDRDLQSFLQRMAGYCLTGSTRDHALFFVYGTGGNGKGTFLNTLQWIMGDYAKAAAADMFTERKHEAHTTELARLMGARMVAAQETEEGKRWAEAKIKALTGGDPVTARFMRQDDFEFIPQFKLVMTGNHKPGLRNVDEAIKRRLHLIPFTVTIPPEKRDTSLADKLRGEAGGILAWAVQGCREWLANGLQPPSSVLAATSEYLEQQDTLAAWIEECCEMGAVTGRSSALYASYKAWAERSSEYVLPMKRWVATMESRGMVSRKSGGVMIYDGIRVMSSEPKQGGWGRDFDL